MKTIVKLACLLCILTLTACGGGEDHAHGDGSAPHAHDGDDAHPHGADGLAQDAPETEALYDDEAEAEVEDAAAEMHSHGDDHPHAHDH
jgi:hypothetical protein